MTMHTVHVGLLHTEQLFVNALLIVIWGFRHGETDVAVLGYDVA
jgi:hypothetical protein